jgi:sugar phosphate isomerase/epimerase
VNTLADAVDVAERTGLGIVADTGNFWMERDLRATLLRAAPHIDLVQLTDVCVGTVRRPDDPPSSGRVPFGEGDLPLTRILGDIKDTGYAGPLELELIGPLGDREGYAPVIRRGVAAAEAMLSAAGL